jgi:hypothetical protein
MSIAAHRPERQCTAAGGSPASGANEKRTGGDRPLQEKMTVQAAASFRLAV